MTTPQEPQKGTMEELAKEYARQSYLHSEENHPKEDEEKALNDLISYHDHQLQKARHDWLREEIVKLEGMKLDIYLGDEYLAGFNEGFNTAINDTVQRYQAELDPVHDFFTAPEEVQRPVYERALQKAQEEQEKLTNNQTL